MQCHVCDVAQNKQTKYWLQNTFCILHSSGTLHISLETDNILHIKSVWFCIFLRTVTVLAQKKGSTDTTERRDDVTLYIMHYVFIAPFCPQKADL